MSDHASSVKAQAGTGDIEVIVRAVLRRGSRILICRDAEHGYAYLPGGHVEFGEPAAAALARELREECGLAVANPRLALVTEGAFTQKGPHHEINLVFHVEHSPGPDQPDDLDEVASLEPDIAVEWLDVASLADTDLRPPAIRAWLMTLADDEGGPVQWVSSIEAPAAAQRNA